MAKVTRARVSSKKMNKLFGADRPIMEPPKVKHSFEKRAYFNKLEREFTHCLTYSFNV
jgi:hypothetical protein